MKALLPILVMLQVHLVYAVGHSYEVVDTAQRYFYSDGQRIAMPKVGQDFYGQDGNYIINSASYTDNNDGTVTDNVTGLVWQKVMLEKMTYQQAIAKAKKLSLAGHTDWRVPTIKELYSLIQFDGQVKGQNAITPFIDTQYFAQPIGSEPGEREIDAQTWSSTEYVGRTMRNDQTVFGVNFVDGRIKGYPKFHPRSKQANKMYFRFVRGNIKYGINDFKDNANGTISDQATGLMWQQSDSLKGMNWQQALSYANNLKLGGFDDWRLPSAKELQSIVDYSRSPSTSDSAAIDSIFYTSSIKNEAGNKDYPYFWTSTTHLDGKKPEAQAVYIAFGTATGEMRNTIMDVHGAGSQRSDPKVGEPKSRGPQGDMIRVDNFVRCVRGGNVQLSTGESKAKQKLFTNFLISNEMPADIQVVKKNDSKLIKRADKNGDGKVSAEEFKGPERHFILFDKNGDGFITEGEAP